MKVALTAKPQHSVGQTLALQRKCACGAGAPALTGECEECRQKKLGLQAKSRVNEPGGVGDVLASPGQALNAALRQDMQQRFGHDFSAVRIHDGSRAAQSARDVNAHAYTVGHDIVFGAGQFAPDTTAGRQLLAHELTHTVQQAGVTRVGVSGLQHDDPNSPAEQEAAFTASTVVQDRVARITHRTASVRVARSPNLDLECGSPLSSGPLAPGTWLTCYRARKIRGDQEDLLRLADSGEILNEQSLLDWAVKQRASQATVLAQIGNSKTFSGSAEVREAGVMALTLAFRTIPLAERREQRHELQLMENEVARQRQVAEDKLRATEAERDRRGRWLGGEGTIQDQVLKTPYPRPRKGKSDAVTYQTYGDTGELVTLHFTDADAYGAYLQKQLQRLQRDCLAVPSELTGRLMVDQQLVKDTLSGAAWYQKPGLWFAGLGFSKEAIAHGVIGAKYSGLAFAEAEKALKALAANRGTPAGESFNDARLLFLQSRHSLNKMLRTREANDEARLSRLETTKEVGRIARTPLGPVAQLVFSTAENAGVRISTMHSDPTATFGFSSFLKETAVSFGSAKLQGALGGADPGFARSFAASLGTTQLSKAVLANDPRQFFNVDPMDVAFTAVGAAHGTWARNRAKNAAATPLTPTLAPAPAAEKHLRSDQPDQPRAETANIPIPLPPAPARPSTASSRTTPITAREAALNFHARNPKIDQSAATLDGLEDIFRRTMSGKRTVTPRPGEYLPSHTRAAAGELDAIRAAQNDPAVTRIRVIPQQSGPGAQRTPDLEVDLQTPNGTVRKEIRTLTGGRAGYQPAAAPVRIDADPNRIASAIRAKIFPSGKRSQLAAGGDLVVQIQHGGPTVDANIAAAVATLNPRLAGAAFLRQIQFLLPGNRAVTYVRAPNGTFVLAP